MQSPSPDQANSLLDAVDAYLKALYASKAVVPASLKKELRALDEAHREARAHRGDDISQLPIEAPERITSAIVSGYQESAIALVGGEDVSVDHNACVSMGADEGAWVAAWVWVKNEDALEEAYIARCLERYQHGDRRLVESYPEVKRKEFRTEDLWVRAMAQKDIGGIKNLEYTSESLNRLAYPQDGKGLLIGLGLADEDELVAKPAPKTQSAARAP